MGHFNTQQSSPAFENLTSVKEGKNAIGNLKPYDDVTALRDNLSAQSVIWICLGVYTALVYF